MAAHGLNIIELVALECMYETSSYLFSLFWSVALETVVQLHTIFTNTVCNQIIFIFIYQSVKRTSCNPQSHSLSWAGGSLEPFALHLGVNCAGALRAYICQLHKEGPAIILCLQI